MAEAEERLNPVSFVATIAHKQALGVCELARLRVRVKGRRLGFGPRNRHRKAPSRLDSPHQTLGESLPEGLPGKPHLLQLGRNAKPLGDEAGLPAAYVGVILDTYLDLLAGLEPDWHAQLRKT